MMNNQSSAGKAADKYPLPSLSEMGLLVSDHIQAMIAYWDKDQICRFANNAYMFWFGKSPVEMIGRITMKELLGPLYEKNLPYINAVLNGVKQQFEREILIPTGEIRYSLATYTPDIINDEVRGFFVHVADVSPLKKLEEEIRKRKREMLKAVIEAQEAERFSLALLLREDICQSLAYCQLILQTEYPRKTSKENFENLKETLKESITKLNDTSNRLSPAVIKDLGLAETLEYLIETFKSEYHAYIAFSHELSQFDNTLLNNSVAIFRIVEGFFELLKETIKTKNISIQIEYKFPLLKIKMTCKGAGVINTNAKAYNDIITRTAYYDGSISAIESDDEKGFMLTLSMP